MEPYIYTDRDGDCLEIGRVADPDQRYALPFAQIARIASGTGTYCVYLTKSAVPEIVRALYQAVGLERQRDNPVCAAMYSPDPETRYDCTRNKNHMGPHMDDGQNTLWVSGWQDPGHHEYRFIDARSDQEKVLVEPVIPKHQCGELLEGNLINYHCADVYGHRGSHGALFWPVNTPLPDGITKGPAGPLRPASLLETMPPWEALTQHMSHQTSAVLDKLSGLEQQMEKRGESSKRQQERALDLAQRVAQLEQTSAGGAATDDMFALQSRRINDLMRRINWLERRIDRLKSPSTDNRGRALCGVLLTWDRESDGTAQCTLPTGHSGLHGLGPLSGDYLSGRPAEEVLLELLRRINRLEGYGTAPAPEPRSLCGIGSSAVNATGDERCDQAPGHSGPHRMGTTTWSQRQGLERDTPTHNPQDVVMDAGGHVYDESNPGSPTDPF